MIVVERIFGWVDGFMAAVRLMPQSAQEGLSPEVWAAIITTLGAGVIGIVGTTLGTKIGAKANQNATLAAAGQLAEVDRRRYIQERLWDERRRAYSLILTNLELAGDSWSYLENGFSEAGREAESFFRSSGYTGLRGEALEQWWAAEKVFSENRLNLSKVFAEKFSHLREAVAQNENDIDPPSEPKKMKIAFRSAFTDLLAISLSEILPEQPSQ